MILTVTVEHCPKCDSLNIVKNGTDYKGDQKYHCHTCGAYGILNPSKGYSEEERDCILRAYQERTSLRGLERIFGVVRQTVLRWIRDRAEALPELADILAPPRSDDVLELDELWSFVFTLLSAKLDTHLNSETIQMDSRNRWKPARCFPEDSYEGQNGPLGPARQLRLLVSDADAPKYPWAGALSARTFSEFAPAAGNQSEKVAPPARGAVAPAWAGDADPRIRWG